MRVWGARFTYIHTRLLGCGRQLGSVVGVVCLYGQCGGGCTRAMYRDVEIPWLYKGVFVGAYVYRYVEMPWLYIHTYIHTYIRMGKDLTRGVGPLMLDVDA